MFGQLIEEVRFVVEAKGAEKRRRQDLAMKSPIPARAAIGPGGRKRRPVDMDSLRGQKTRIADTLKKSREAIAGSDEKGKKKFKAGKDRKFARYLSRDSDQSVNFKHKSPAHQKASNARGAIAYRKMKADIQIRSGYGKKHGRGVEQ